MGIVRDLIENERPLENSSAVTISNFANNISNNGYQKLPSGLIIQWGISSVEDAAVTLPISFPNSFFIVIATIQGTYSNVTEGIETSIIDTSSFKWKYGGNTGDNTAFWLAIGY